MDAAEDFLQSQGLADSIVYNVVLLMSEAVQNAMEHGNRWDAEKSVSVTIRRAAGRIDVSVTDEGEGFDVTVQSDPLGADNQLKDGGRGRFLMDELADEVVYEMNGRRVRLVFLVGN